MNRTHASQADAPGELAGEPGPRRRLLTCSALSGDTVVNREDETLGTISDIMFDVQRGCIAYVVMASGGFMGMGERLFALPWKALRLDLQRRCAVLDVDRAALDDAPGFDRSHWPDEADEQWQRQVHRHYGMRPYWE